MLTRKSPFVRLLKKYGYFVTDLSNSRSFIPMNYR